MPPWRRWIDGVSHDARELGTRTWTRAHRQPRLNVKTRALVLLFIHVSSSVGILVYTGVLFTGGFNLDSRPGRSSGRRKENEMKRRGDWKGREGKLGCSLTTWQTIRPFENLSRRPLCFLTSVSLFFRTSPPPLLPRRYLFLQAEWNRIVLVSVSALASSLRFKSLFGKGAFDFSSREGNEESRTWFVGASVLVNARFAAMRGDNTARWAVKNIQSKTTLCEMVEQ